MRMPGFFGLPHIIVAYGAFAALSALLLGSGLAVIAAGLIAALVFFCRIEWGLSLFLVSCMVNIPLLHIPPTESLALRINDIVLFSLLAKVAASLALSRSKALPVVPRPYRWALGLLALSAVFSAGIACLGGVGAEGIGLYPVNASYLANLAWTLGRSLGYIATFFLFAHSAAGTRQRIAYLKVLYGAIFVAAAYAVLEFLGVLPHLWELLGAPWQTIHAEAFGREDIVGSFNRNHSQIGIVTTLGAILGLAMLMERRKLISSEAFMLAVILLALLVSQKRAAYMAVLVGCMVLCLIEWRRVIRPKNVFGLLAVGVAVAGVSLFTGVGDLVQERIEPNLEANSPEQMLTGRIVIWRDALEYIREQPEVLLLGRGLLYQEQVGIGMSWKRQGAHNEWLGVAIERGVLGLLGLLLTVAVLVAGALKRRRVRPSSPLHLFRSAYLAHMAAALVFSVASHAFIVDRTTGSYPALFFSLSALVVLAGRFRLFFVPVAVRPASERAPAVLEAGELGRQE